MKFKTHNDKEIDVNGTSLEGYIDLSYNTLVKVLGEPDRGDEYKVDAEWIIEFEDGTVATIYNYKDGKNYNGNEGADVEDIIDWHIGGHVTKAVELVTELFEGIDKSPKEKVINLPCYGIAVTLSPDRKGGTVVSDLHYSVTDEIEKNFENEAEHNKYESAIDALESLILAHACAGVDIESPAYIEGIETAEQAIANNI